MKGRWDFHPVCTWQELTGRYRASICYRWFAFLSPRIVIEVEVTVQPWGPGGAFGPKQRVWREATLDEVTALRLGEPHIADNIVDGWEGRVMGKKV